MENKTIIGLPKMEMEANEIRAFSPLFVSRLAKMGAGVILEDGYGEEMGYSLNDYEQILSNVTFEARETVFQQPYVLILRYPGEADLLTMQSESCLISMLQFRTKPRRAHFIRSLDLNAIALEEIKDDSGHRLVESNRIAAQNALDAAFHELSKEFRLSPRRKTINLALMGSSELSEHVIAATDQVTASDGWNIFAEKGLTGIKVVEIEAISDHDEWEMMTLLSNSDLLVDASRRADLSRAPILNHWIEVMPKHAVLVDISGDPYDRGNPPDRVKAIQGMPQGDLDHYVFYDDDPSWETSIPESIPSLHKRTAASCTDWSGLTPKSSMARYESQLEHLLQELFKTGYTGLSHEGNPVQRALFRGTLHSW
jgi:alanine dehydrogenase